MYTVTFKVTDGVNPLAGATVVYSNITKTTDAAGQAIFTNMLYATGITYTITAPGFKKTVVSFDVFDNVTKTIVLSSENTALDEQEPICIYPNPAIDFITISGAEARSELVIYSINGTVVMRKILDGSPMVDISSLSSGLYIIKIKNSSSSVESKLVKN